VNVMLVALALAAALQSSVIQRQAHDHTIYTVRGSADQLAKFQDEIGSRWSGGTLVSKDEKNGQYRYWALSERTAPQAREFMFGSMMSGLKLDIEAYDERQSFPAERAELDSIALGCGLSVDPFFITPKRELRVGPYPGVSFESVDCMLGKLKSSTVLSGIPTGFVGAEAPREKVN
jgi:hypothetical protein